MKKLYVMLAAALLLALLSGCAFTEKLAQLDLPEPPGKETATPAPDPEEAAAEQARQEELNARREEAIARAEELRQQYFYDEAIAALSDEEIVNEQVEAELAAIRAEKDSLFGFPPRKLPSPNFAAEQYRICTMYSAPGRRLASYCRHRLRRPPV